jgi:hypothetical protein
MLIKQHPVADIHKGKMIVVVDQGFKRRATDLEMQPKVKMNWIAPVQGEAKINTDGAFTMAGAGIGMILRGANGVIVAACRHILHCLDATEAELLAIEEGLCLAMHWFPG